MSTTPLPPEADPATLLTLARTCMDRLAASSDPAAFEALLALSQEIGGYLGASARTLAEQGSWARVASAAGTTRQAAWSRWHNSEP